MKLTSYLVFNGQAEEAIHFYAKVLNGKIDSIHRYESLPDIPDNYKQKVIHAGLIFDDGELWMADAMPSEKADFGRLGHMLTLSFDSIEQIENVYAQLCDGAQEIRCQLSETFFAKRYAEVYDRFGVLWALMVDEM